MQSLENPFVNSINPQNAITPPHWQRKIGSNYIYFIGIDFKKYTYTNPHLRHKTHINNAKGRGVARI